MAPPDPIPNSEVKRFSADDSLGSPHAKVGHCQVLNDKPQPFGWGFFIFRFSLYEGNGQNWQQLY